MAEFRQHGIDFSELSVEDAVLLMFMLISERAKGDMKGMLQEMNETRLQRSQMREVLIRLTDQAEGRKIKWPPC